MNEHIQKQHLSPQQRNALHYVEKLAIHKRSEARQVINEILARTEVTERTWHEALQSIQAHAQVVLNFHPERLSVKHQTVAEGLLQDGIYKNQFETGLSSGSPTAFPGGERDVWEKRLFGDAYHVAGIALSDRPKYGALDFRFHPDGAAPRFGSCYFVLRADVTKRCSLTFGGSHEDLALERTGTLATLEPVMAALLNEVEKGQGALGVSDLTIPDLLAQLTHGLAILFENPSTRPLGRALDSMIEAQIHGTISLYQDVERLVADPVFHDHEIGQILETLCSQYGIILNWHPGFVLPVNRVPNFFRGFAVRSLADRVAENGLLDAAIIGAAANSLQLSPELWRDWGSYDDILTQFRRLWHVLVLYGMPRGNAYREKTDYF